MLLAALLAVSSPVFVGTGQVDITPPEPLPLGGYTERQGRLFEPGGDRLYARCALIQQGGTAIALVSVEMLTVPESLVREVRARIPSGTKLFMAATHTHSAPDSQMLNDRMAFSVPGIARFAPQWLTWYAERIARCVLEAGRDARWPVDRLGVRVGFLDANAGRRPGARPDQTLTAFGRSGFLVVHYAAHAVLHGPSRTRLSGDWPGAVMGLSPPGAHPVILVLPGAIGDVSPRAEGGTPEERVHRFAGEVGSRLVGRRPAAISPDPVGWAETPIELSRPVPHPEFAKRYGVPEALARSIVERFAPPQASVSAFRIGKLAVVGIPGEPTSHLGRRIRDAGRRAGFSHVLVCSHVNGWMGYILEPSDYDRGGYEATLSFHGRDQGERAARAAEAALRQLARAAAPSGAKAP